MSEYHMSSSRTLVSLCLAGAFTVLLMACTMPGSQAQPTQAPASSGSPPAGSASPREACEGDIKTYCPSAAGDRSKIQSCMRENEAKLKPGCRTALQNAGLLSK